eukprot:7280970-Prymnesium_polylepis.1
MTHVERAKAVVWAWCGPSPPGWRGETSGDAIDTDGVEHASAPAAMEEGERGPFNSVSYHVPAPAPDRPIGLARRRCAPKHREYRRLPLTPTLLQGGARACLPPHVPLI